MKADGHPQCEEPAGFALPQLQARAKRQRRSVAQEVTQILSDALIAPKPVSILELRGLGKEHWKAIEATRLVEVERAAWD